MLHSISEYTRYPWIRCIYVIGGRIAAYSLILTAIYGCFTLPDPPPKDGGKRGQVKGDGGVAKKDGEAPGDSGRDEKRIQPTDGNARKDASSVISCADISCYNDAISSGRCTESNTGIIVSQPVGTCHNGSCQYVGRTETCSSGACVNGVCTDTPCQGVTCFTPLKPTCSKENPNLLTVYGEMGRCFPTSDLPKCSYPSSPVVCTNGCENGKCRQEPCTGVVCDKPPAGFCDGATLAFWNQSGRCVEGNCKYDAERVDCGVGGCESGQCAGVSACAHVVCAAPPANHCISSSTLRTFVGRGICEEGRCLYEQRDVACEGGCERGQCLDDSCQGVVCDRPPASYCKAGSSTLMHWDGVVGTCQGAMCKYEMAAQNCPNGCEDGRCTDDECAGVVCVDPPANYCDGDSLVEWIRPGTCRDAGICVYQPQTIHCPSGCQHGRCQE